MEVLTNYRGSTRKLEPALPRKKQKLLVVKPQSRCARRPARRAYSMRSSHSETTGSEQADITGLIGQYAHGNEPSHHIAYLYNATNNPRRKTSYWVQSKSLGLAVSKCPGWIERK